MKELEKIELLNNTVDTKMGQKRKNKVKTSPKLSAITIKLSILNLPEVLILEEKTLYPYMLYKMQVKHKSCQVSSKLLEKIVPGKYG